MCAVEYYTYDDYCQWKGDWELVSGVPLAMAPAPMIQHLMILKRPHVRLLSILRKRLNVLETKAMI